MNQGHPPQTSWAWAVGIDPAEFASLGPLRLAPGAEICDLGDMLWVRGPQLDEHLAAQLHRHPHARRHWVLADGQLLSPGKRVPRGHLPTGPWHPLTTWLQVGLPPIFDAAGQEAPTGIAHVHLPLVERVTLRLVRGGIPQIPNVLLTSIDALRSVAAEVPRLRLQRWKFAADSRGRVVVWGTPLPDLPGQIFVEDHQVAVPVGWTWEPAVTNSVVCELAKLDTGDLGLWHSDQSREILGGDSFVRASRGAIRATVREFTNA
jgi:hypothetical protein